MHIILLINLPNSTTLQRFIHGCDHGCCHRNNHNKNPNYYLLFIYFILLAQHNIQYTPASNTSWTARSL